MSAADQPLLLPSFPDISSIIPPSFKPFDWLHPENDDEGVFFGPFDFAEDDIVRAVEDPECLPCVQGWKDSSNGNLETETCTSSRAVELRIGGMALRDQGLKELAGKLLPDLRSLATCKGSISITAGEAFDILYRAAADGGCYGGCLKEDQALLKTWTSMFALAGISHALPSIERRSFLPENELPPIAAVLPLSLLCHRAIYAQKKEVDERLAVMLEHMLPPMFQKPGNVSQQMLWEFLLCALSLESCTWFSFDSEWHDEAYEATCWRVGLVCLAPDRKRVGCVAAVDTD